MQVIFNRWSTRGAKTGVGHHASELLHSLQELAPAQVVAYPPDWAMMLERQVSRLRRRLKNLRARRAAGPWNVLASLARPPLRGGWQLAKIAAARQHVRQFHGQRFDLYHEPNFIPFQSSLPTVTTIHDLSPLVHPEWHPADRLRWFDQNIDRALEQSRHVLAVSEFTRQEIIRLLGVPPSRVTCIGNGVRPCLRPLPAGAVAAGLRRLGLPPRYLVYLGTIEPRKNVLRLFQAYCSLPDQVRAAWPLVLVGQWGWKAGQEWDFYHQQGRHQGIRHVGYVADRDLALLYNGARALIYPSHYEGFGLPPVEMQACGGAVLISRAAALLETAGSAHSVEAEDTDGWRQALLRVTQDDEWWQALRCAALAAAGMHSWQRAAQKTLRVYQAVLEGSSIRSGPLPEPAARAAA